MILNYLTIVDCPHFRPKESVPLIRVAFLLSLHGLAHDVLVVIFDAVGREVLFDHVSLFPYKVTNGAEARLIVHLLLHASQSDGLLLLLRELTSCVCGASTPWKPSQFSERLSFL